MFHFNVMVVDGPYLMSWDAKDCFSQSQARCAAGKIARFGVRTRRGSAREEGSVRCDAALFPQLALLATSGLWRAFSGPGEHSPPLVFPLG